MAKKDKTVEAPKEEEVVKIDESDFQERVQGFSVELQKLLGKYELGLKPHAVLQQVTGSEAMCIVPQIQFISDRKPPTEKGKEEAVEKPESDLVKD